MLKYPKRPWLIFLCTAAVSVAATADELSPQRALDAYRESLQRLKGLEYQVQVTGRDDPDHLDWEQQWFSSCQSDHWAFHSTRRQRSEHATGSSATMSQYRVLYGKWSLSIATSGSGIAQSIEVAFPASPDNPTAVIGSQGFFFVHGYATGVSGKSFLPELMSSAENLSIQAEADGNENLLVVESNSVYGRHRLWLDRSRAMAAVRLEVQKGPSHSFGRNTLQDVGIRQYTLNVKCSGWKRVADVDLPTRIDQKTEMVTNKGKEVATETSHLSGIQRVHRSLRDAVGGFPDVAGDTTIAFDKTADTSAPWSDDFRRLYRVVSPLESRFSARFPRTRAGVHEKLERVVDALKALEETREEPLVASIAPAIEGGLLERRRQFEGELARLDALESMIGRAVPTGILQRLDGTPTSLTSLIDGRVALISFWGYSCATCRTEAPYLSALHKQYEKSGLTVVAVNCFKDSRQLAEKYIEQTKLDVPILLNGHLLADKFHVSSAPAHFWVDHNGNVVSYDFGFSSDGDRIELETKAMALLRDRNSR